MATVTKPKYVSLDDEKVSISNYTTTDSDIYDFFDKDESNDLDEKFEQALKIGVIGAKNIDTAGHVHFFQKEANKISAEIDQKINDILGENGIVADIVTKTFGVDGKLVNDLLNPKKEGPPLQLAVHEIKTSVHTDIEDLTSALQVNKGKAEEADRGTQKGKAFEDYLEELLGEIAKIHGDSVRPTGTEAGMRTDCDKGDFVYDIKELNKRIVWEAKKYNTRLTEPKINDYLDEAIENREADYGILVSRNVEALNKDIGWFKELSDKKLVIALGTKNNDPELHPEILHIAYRWARAKLRQDTLQSGGFDPTFVNDKIIVLQEKLKDLESIKGQCKNIDTASTEIKNLAEGLNEELDNTFEEILESLQ